MSLSRNLSLCFLLGAALVAAPAWANDTGPGSGKIPRKGQKLRLRASEPGQLSAAELELWNSASFKRRFAESYIAETEIEPPLTEDETEEILEIMELFGEDRLDDAREDLVDFIDGTTSAAFDFLLANIHHQREEYGPAVESYEKAIAKWPKFRRAHRNLGLIHVRLDDYQKASASLARVIELGGHDAITYGLLGFAYSNMGKHIESESAYRMASLLDPLTPDWKMGLARSFFEQKRYADAAALFQSMIDDDPERHDLWLLQANAYIGLEQPLKAAENYEIVDQLGKSTPDSLNMLGDIYTNHDLYDLASKAYVRALEVDTQESPARAIRAASVMAANTQYPATKRMVTEIRRLRSAALTDEQHAQLLKLSARVAVSEGADDEQARILEQIVEVDPLDGEAMILLGQHYGRTEQIERAAMWFERAAKLEAHERRAKVRHAQMLVNNARYAEALPLLRSAQSLEYTESIQNYLVQVERHAKSGGA